MLVRTNRTDPQNASIQNEFNALFRRHYRRIHSLAYRLTGNASVADDLTQDAFVNAWRHFPRYNRQRPFDRWVSRIVTNLAIDSFRRQRRVSTVSMDVCSWIDGEQGTVMPRLVVTDGTPEDILLSREIDESILQSLNALPAVFRSAVLLADVEELSYLEIAVIQKCPIGTVRSRIHRARLKLRSALTASRIYPVQGTHCRKEGFNDVDTTR